MFLCKRLSLIAIIIALLIAMPAMAADLPLFRFNGFDYNKSELPANLRSQLFELEQETHEKLQQLIDTAVLDIYLQEEAERSGKSIDELRKQLLSVEEPDEIIVKEFYEANKQRIQAPFEQVRERLKQYMMQQQYQRRQSALLTEVKQKYPLEILVPAPIAPRIEIATEGFPSKGDADAKVTIVEFADYQCPHCRKASFAVKQVMEKYADQVKLVYMDQPIINKRGLDSRTLSEGAVCADQQGKFWAYHDLVFQRQAELRPDSMPELVQQLELNQEAFQKCFEAAETKAKVAKSKAEALRIGVTSTPTFFVNGKLIVTDDVVTGLTEAIESALK